jgi:hypothetical protein
MGDNRKVQIELRPYTAIAVLSFLREYINQGNRDMPMLQAIHESVEEYEKQVCQSITQDQIEDARLENDVNFLTKRQPPLN